MNVSFNLSGVPSKGATFHVPASRAGGGLWTDTPLR
jgi:hypothetical protein